jgi:pimeloyl-ACP methyl ester carboxylesterase
MNIVTSSDGTAIAFEQTGHGPPVILVDGALCYRAGGPARPLAAQLADRFTVYTYDRRGRGDSGDTAPYSVDREVEDIEALIKHAGGSAYVYGISSGAALSLEAARRGLAIDKLALYEAPFLVDDSRPPMPDTYLPTLTALIAAGRRGDAVRYFLRNAVGLPAVVVTLMRFMPAWSKLTSVAHTLAYDHAILGDCILGRPLPIARWASATSPTLVVAGGKSPQWMLNAMRSLAGVLPNAQYRVLDGQTHMVKPKALAPVLADFFAG